MAIPVATLLPVMAAALIGSRCQKPDVSTCSTAEAEKLMTFTPLANAPGLVQPQNRGFGRSSTTLTYMAHKAAAWGDQPGSELRHPPVEVDRILLTVPSAQVEKGTFTLRCPAIPAVEVCDAWVFFYHCPQSCTPKYQAGVTLQLPADGWMRTRCAPHFATGVPSGYSHDMKSYRKKLAPGESVDIVVAEETEFIFFGLDTEAVDCSKFTSELTCGAAQYSSCVWSDMGECEATQCRRGGKGPPPPCTECPWQGITTRPAQDGPY